MWRFRENGESFPKLGVIKMHTKPQNKKPAKLPPPLIVSPTKSSDTQKIYSGSGEELSTGDLVYKINNQISTYASNITEESFYIDKFCRVGTVINLNVAKRKVTIRWADTHTEETFSAIESESSINSTKKLLAFYKIDEQYEKHLNKLIKEQEDKINECKHIISLIGTRINHPRKAKP